MNYKELVLSKSPDGYVNYDAGSATDLIGLIPTTYTTNDLNPVYDSTVKKHGVRSKKIGHLGLGVYDRINFTILGSENYWHLEGWVYLTAANTADFVEIFPFNVNETYPCYTRILTSRKIRWYTQSPINGTGDNTLDSIATIPVGTWTHVAVQFYAGVKKIFINGVLDNQVTVTSHPLRKPSDILYTPVTTYFDEFCFWAKTSSTGMPTDADILQRATFPITKTKVWNATNGIWVQSGDEQYWNGTEWTSMQDLTYKVWNGTDWVTL